MRIIGGLFKGRTLAAPKGDETRPTQEQVRGAVFNICQGLVTGSRFLDLFSGSGAMGLEALSRGADSATFVENNRLALEALKKNCESLKVKERSFIWPVSALGVLKKLEDNHAVFDMVFADPPYSAPSEENPLSVRILQEIDNSSLLQKGAVCFLEEGHASIRSEWPTLKLESLRRYGSTWLYHFKKL